MHADIIPPQSFLRRGAEYSPSHREALDRPTTLGEAIRRNSETYPCSSALVSTGFKPLTYRALQHQIDTMRTHLREAGLGATSRIGVLLPNSPLAVVAIVTVVCSAVAVPLDPRLTAAELEQCLESLDLDALLLLHGSPSAGRSTAECEGLAILDVIPHKDGELGFTVVAPRGGSPPPPEEPGPNAPAFILQTSGTTALPKLIPFSHSNMLAAAERLQAWFHLKPQDRCLSVSPPFYSHGLKVTVFTPLVTGGSIALPSNSLAVDFAEWFDALRPTWYSAGPTLHRSVLDTAGSIPDAAAMHTLRFVLSGGAPLPASVREELQGVLGTPVVEHYGLSEAAQIAANVPPPGMSKPGTCGQPWPGTLMIVGDDGNPLPAGEQGEVWVRGPTAASGYLNDPGSSASAFVDGWFRTGDIGSLDHEGFLTLHGRLKELINRGGEKIAPFEVDHALLRHPAVAEAAAFGIAHPRLGEDVAAAVVLHPGATTTASELRKFLVDHLASFKVPRKITIVDTLPKGVTGKIQRRRLAESLSMGTRELVAAPPSVSIPGPLDLETELLHLWQRLLKSDAITIDDDFFEKGGDSLLAMEMLTEIDWLIDPQVACALLLESPTIRRLVPRLNEHASLPAEPLVHLHPEGTRPPLLFFHGDFVTGGIYVRRLASLLGPDQPIIAIAPHGLRGEPVPPTIEEMAADRMPLILEKLPEGPFWLGGLCNGALVAFELARLLVNAGHRVETVVMIDPPTASARPIMRITLSVMQRIVSPQTLAWIYERVIERYERALRMTPWQLLTKAAAKVRRKGHALLNGHSSPPRSLHLDAYSIAMARYSPAPLAVPVVFFAADHDGRAWRRLTSEVEVIDLPGGHLGCVTTNAAPLVEHLRQRIAVVDMRAKQATGACS